jgi:hypothetical protein
MANAKSLRRIGFGLGAVTMLVIVVAASLVADPMLTPADPPMVHAAMR